MSQQNKTNLTNLFDNFKIPKAPKASNIVNHFDNYKDLYKYEKEYFVNENDNNLTGFSYINLLKRGFDIFNSEVNSYYGYYNGNSKFNVEFNKAQENYNYLHDKLTDLDQELEIQDQDQDQDQNINKDQDQKNTSEVNNDPK